MRERIIHIKPFSFLSILDFQCTKKIGNHTYAYVKGHISEEQYQEVVKSFSYSTDIIITATHQDSEEILLNGIVEELSTFTENDMRVLQIKIISHSIKSDLETYVRTFQESDMTYGRVKSIIESESKENISILIPEHSGEQIQSMLVQYEETNWEFAKRVASRLNTIVVSDYKTNASFISIGRTTGRSAIPVNTLRLIERTEFSEYTKNTDVEGYSPSSCKYYEFSSREIYEICDNLILNGMNLYIWKIITTYDGEQLLHTYTLKFEEGFKVKEYYNKNLIGNELMGGIFEIDKQNVKVTVYDDVSDKSYRWFDYATSYSSPSNIGWYFMPEKNDAIRLCFPTEKEKDAYVASAVHKGSRDDHNIKSIRTIHNKEIIFAPGYIHITNGDSEIYLDDEYGIMIQSRQNINIQAQKNMTINSNSKVLISANEQVQVNQNEAQIDIKDGSMDITGRHVRTR